MDPERPAQQSRNLLRTSEENFRLVQTNVESIIDKGGQANLARIHRVPLDQADTASISSKIQSQQYNPVTGLPREDAFRMELLDSIVTDVIKGDKDLAIAEFDMDGLKGYNDKYGEDEADKILAGWVSQMMTVMLDSAEHDNFDFTIINVHGEGSDSVKIIFIGHGLKQKVTNSLKNLLNSTAVIKMSDREGNPVDETVKFGFGSHVISEQLRLALKSPEAEGEVRHKAGDLYQSISQDAKSRLEASKVYDEAHFVKALKEARTLQELDRLFDDLVVNIPRASSDLTSTYSEMRKKLGGA